MRVMAIDDEQLALEDVLRCVAEVTPTADAQGFRGPNEALAWIKDNPCDVALLDIEMPGMSGIALAKRLKDVRPNLNIIFVTSHERYAFDAFAVHATGYLLKPVDAADLARELAFACGPDAVARATSPTDPPVRRHVPV